MMFIKIKIYWIVLYLLSFLMSGCTYPVNANYETRVPRLSFKPSATIPQSTSPIPVMVNTITVSLPTSTFTPSFIPSATDTPIPTATPIPTDTPLPSETPTLEWNPPGYITAPILLYHHVSNDGPGIRYIVTMDDFREQMETLRDLNYLSITASDLANVIIYGGERPNRSVVITFDDGFMDVYQNAFPIMQELGFVGVVYIYVDHVGSNGYVNAEQIRVLADNGWEIGNHSMSHADLTKNHTSVYYEVQQSRLTLEELTGEKADTFAYPYGVTNDYVIGVVRDSGYLAGMGLGLSCDHTLDTLYNLSRIEVQADYSISTFRGLLPWSGN